IPQNLAIPDMRYYNHKLRWNAAMTWNAIKAAVSKAKVERVQDAPVYPDYITLSHRLILFMPQPILPIPHFDGMLAKVLHTVDDQFKWHPLCHLGFYDPLVETVSRVAIPDLTAKMLQSDYGGGTLHHAWNVAYMHTHTPPLHPGVYQVSTGPAHTAQLLSHLVSSPHLKHDDIGLDQGQFIITPTYMNLYPTAATTEEDRTNYETAVHRFAPHGQDISKDVLIAITVTNIRGKSVVIPIEYFGQCLRRDGTSTQCSLAQCFRWFFSAGRHVFYVMNLAK
ncbi:MAG: hypothetical protein GY740_01890, partial [Gammaproteobacteria bacterium]|nr:hypothetical protein [Gammaproteobacteria bacterium]